jgi:pantoate--beta-alanine ligase
MSSRNERLSPDDRQKAGVIYRTLNYIKENYSLHPIPELKAMASENIASQPDIKLEYLEIVHPDTLQPISSKTETEHPVACIAVSLAGIRLIDNMIL